MQGRTQQERTSEHTRFRSLAIQNRDPEYDYSFQRKKDLEEGGQALWDGWEAIGESNFNNELFSGLPPTMATNTKGRKSLVYLDTIACKRKKSTTRYIRAEEDEKYNAQINLINTASKRAQEALRKLAPDSAVIDSSTHVGPGMTQRKGPTEEEDGKRQ